MKLLEKNLHALIVAGMLGLCLGSPLAVTAAEDDVTQKLFDEAMEKRDTGDIFAAIDIFEALLSANPDLNRVRLELAVAYHQAGKYQAATRELKTVLDAPDTPENVRLSILAYLGQVAKDEKKPEGQHYLSYYVKAGMLHNSNLNASQAIGTGLNPSAPTELASVGSDLVLNVAHRYARKRPLDLAGNTTSFEWQSQATFSSNVYSKDNDFNLHVATVSTGPAFNTPGRWRASALLQADYIVLGDSALATFVSFNPGIRFDLGNYSSLVLESSYTTHSYSDVANAGYDGSETLFGIGYAMYLPAASTGFEIGLRDSNNDADDDAYSYDFDEIYAGGFKSLSEQSSLYLRVHARDYEYVAVDPNVGVIRDESETYVALGYNHDYQQGMLKGWTLNVEYSSVNSDSNADSLDYRRNLFSLNWSRYFR